MSSSLLPRLVLAARRSAQSIPSLQAEFEGQRRDKMAQLLVEQASGHGWGRNFAAVCDFRDMARKCFPVETEPTREDVAGRAYWAYREGSRTAQSAPGGLQAEWEDSLAINNPQAVFSMVEKSSDLPKGLVFTVGPMGMRGSDYTTLQVRGDRTLTQRGNTSVLLFSIHPQAGCIALAGDKDKDTFATFATRNESDSVSEMAQWIIQQIKEMIHFVMSRCAQVPPGGLQEEWEKQRIGQMVSTLVQKATEWGWSRTSTNHEDFYQISRQLFHQEPLATRSHIASMALSKYRANRNPRTAQVPPGGLQDEWEEQEINRVAQEILKRARARGWDPARILPKGLGCLCPPVGLTDRIQVFAIDRAIELSLDERKDPYTPS